MNPPSQPNNTSQNFPTAYTSGGTVNNIANGGGVCNIYNPVNHTYNFRKPIVRLMDAV